MNVAPIWRSLTELHAHQMDNVHGENLNGGETAELEAGRALVETISLDEATAVIEGWRLAAGNDTYSQTYETE
jgi:hypothetical protein